MPGFWTVFKWVAAITLAPIVVWLAILLVIAAIAINNENPPPRHPAPRSVRHGAR